MRGPWSDGGRRGRSLPANGLKPIGYLLLALVANPVSGQSREELPIDLVPAWEGYYRPGAATELTVVARAVVDEAVVTAQVTGSAPATSTEFVLGPGHWPRRGFAVRPSGNDLVVGTSLGSGELREHAIELTTLSQPLVAIIADQPSGLSRWLAQGDVFKPLPVAADELPQTPGGYEPVSGIVIGRDPRPELQPAQQAALNAYLRRCGRAFTTEADTEAALMDVAGCDGQFIARVDGPGELAAYLRTLPRDLPRYQELRRLLGGPPRLLLVAAAFIGLYCLFIGLLATRRQAARPVPMLLAAPIFASLLMLAVWLRDPPESRLLVWAEQGDHEPARYRAILDLYSQGVGEIDLPLDSALGLPTTLADQPTEFIRRDPSANTLRWQPVLLSRLTVGLDGSTTPRPSLAIENEATPSVRNRGADRSAAAILAYRGRYYTVPALAPGEAWAPDEATPSLSRVDVPAPLTSAGRLALLIPLQADEIPVGLPRAEAATGWLLRRGAEETR